MDFHSRTFLPISSPQHALSITNQGALGKHLLSNQDLHILPTLVDAFVPLDKDHLKQQNHLISPATHSCAFLDAWQCGKGLVPRSPSSLKGFHQHFLCHYLPFHTYN
uniref:Transcription factor bHLH140 n=1 Tax=Rhizophora mucronata TaxID=61149 RepID=A0A2P2K905_RHIMU